MSYQIIYGGPVPRRSSTSLDKRRFYCLLAGSFLLFCLITKAFWPAGTEIMQRLLFSGDPKHTAQAVEVLMADLREGEGFTHSVTAFCVEITEHAENTD